MAEEVVNSSNSGQFSNDPYFIHHNDNPGTILVSQILTRDNYASWSRSLKIALLAKNKFEFVDNSLPKPNEADVERLNSWLINNNIVISWILNVVSKEIYASIIYLETASDIWKELQQRFQQGQDSVSNYYTKLKVLWEELILLMEPLPSVNKIFSLIIQEERQRDIGIPSTNDPVLAFNFRANNQQNNYLNKNRNYQNNYKNNKKESPYCTHCKRAGHKVLSTSWFSTWI
ncbi:hypothetical protein Lser_V15G10096 [Lactuca serriola]